MSFDDFPVASNDGQKNLFAFDNMTLARVAEKMGVLQDTEPGQPRGFLDRDGLMLSGYDGVVVQDGKVVSLVNRDGWEGIPVLSVGSELVVEGDSRGHVSSGHKPGNRVKVLQIIEPFYEADPVNKSTDKIVQVEGHGLIGWIKPSEFDKNILLEEIEKETQRLFSEKGGE